MAKKKERAVNVSAKPKHSLDVNRNNAAADKGTRSAGTVRRLKMYNTRPKRGRKGKILKHDLQSNDLPNKRIEPDRCWFGNTRVINQKELEFFREELRNRLSSKYNVILKERKLPLSLLNDHQKDEEEAELNIEPFSRVVNSNPEENSDDEGYDFDGFLETLSAHDLGIEEINEEDEAALAVYFGSDAGPQLTLADIIIKKIKEKDLQASSEERPMPKFDDGVINVYRRVGNVLSRYTSGKVPKALQRIAIMERWEEVLYITEPEKWSPNAIYQATRIFASRFNPNRAQRFYKLVLLPRVREEIQKNKQLHRAIYEAVKKSLYKPAGFFKGILFPLCQSQTCTLIEAHIIGSIIQKVSIPPLHSSVALMTLAGMEYYGTTSFFIKLLIEKKYALPYRILDALVAHFMRFLEDKRAMPVIWHQTLLAFVQRYKNELTKENKTNLDRLMHHQKHYLVTPEIRRELKNSRQRGEKEDITLQAPLISVINKPIKEDRWDIPDVPMEED